MTHIKRTATCRDCGTVEPSSWAGPRYRCAGCESRYVEWLREQAASGMSQTAIASREGVSAAAISLWCRRHGIDVERHPAARPALTTRNLAMRSIFEMGAT